jgi:Shedu protein SduA, C-terminal
LSRFEDWNPSLSHRRGTPVRLLGIDIYHDFKWSDVVRHGMNQFPNGQCLAQLAREHCGSKRPALLLTDNDSELEGPFETDTHHFVVVHLPRYLREATPNAAVSYLARRRDIYEAQMAMLEQLSSRPDLVEQLYTAETVAQWLTTDPSRSDQVQESMSSQAVVPRVEPGQLVAALRALESMDSAALEALAEFFGSHDDPDVRLALLRAVTGNTGGRLVTGAVLAERTADRIADARAAMAAYEELLDDPAVRETEMQAFIAQNLWLLGLDYAKMTPHQRLLTGTMDFILERFDGFQDVLELKDPHDPIVTVQGDVTGDAAPPPSSFALSKDLALGLAQAHAYRDRLTRHAEATEDLLGLRLSRDPRLVIVIGRSDQMDEHSRRVLRELNKSLHRVEVVPYDVLLQRSRALLDNVEKYLLAAESEPEPSASAEGAV